MIDRLARLAGGRTLRRSFRWIRSRLGSRALVLGYHRVADTPEDPFDLCVSPLHFEAHLEVIGRHARLLPLGQLLEQALKGEVSRGAVALTFDDGYADLLHVARPILARHGAPATVFVVTGSLGRRFWWDALAEVVREGVSRGAPLHLTLATGDVRWHPAGERESGPPASAAVLQKERSLARELYRHLRGLDAGGRRQALEELGAWAGSLLGSDPGAEADDRVPRAFDAGELRALLDNGLLEAGAHTHTHPDLTELDPAARRYEIARSRDRLHELLDEPVEGFAYPFGRFTAQVAEEVRAAGFRWACASRNDAVRPGAAPYSIPRFWPGDWDGDRFERWLRRWL